jgi:phage FluMu protein Com
MEINRLRCPACGATAPSDIKPNEQFRCTACGSVLVLTDTEPPDQVLCTRCQTINDGANRFCTHCGNTLQANCPFCYTPNEFNATYCVQCGANIEKAFQQKAEWLAQKRQSDAERRAALEQALAKQRRTEMERLLDKLDEPSEHAFAIYCLREYGTDAVEPLIALLRDDDPDARFGAAHTLGLIGDTRAVPQLINALSDPEPAVRWWAADALGKLRATDAKPEISKLLKDKHRGVREHAASVLRQLSG